MANLEIYKYLLLVSYLIWKRIRSKINDYMVGRILEGISIGIYANNINISNGIKNINKYLSFKGRHISNNIKDSNIMEVVRIDKGNG